MKMKKLFFIILLITGCELNNNPFYPEARIKITVPDPTVVVNYEVRVTAEETSVTSQTSPCELIFEEIYGGTYIHIDSVRVEYYNPGPPIPYRDSIIGTLIPYTSGFPLYIPAGEQINATFDVVTDEVENLMAPLNGSNFEGPIGVKLTFYGTDGNHHLIKDTINILVQRYITDVPTPQNKKFGGSIP